MKMYTKKIDRFMFLLKCLVVVIGVALYHIKPSIWGTSNRSPKTILQNYIIHYLTNQMLYISGDMIISKIQNKASVLHNWLTLLCSKASILLMLTLISA